MSDLPEKEKVIKRTKGKVIMKATVATVVTARKVNLKAMMWKVIASLTPGGLTKKKIIQLESTKPCRHCQKKNMSVTAVVKCPRCFWHDNNSIAPFVVTTSRLIMNI